LSIKNEVYQNLRLPIEEVTVERGAGIDSLLKSVIDPATNTCIISAGGDGSVHYLVNYLMTLERMILKNLVLGAVGLGSSNDFLKPFGKKINGIPVRINCYGKIIAHDLGLLQYLTDDSIPKQKYFVVNASLGVTAKANYDFNNPGAFLKFLKQNSTATAIVYTAISSILGYKNTRCKIDLNGWQSEVDLSNANVLKLPFVSGSFFYREKISRDDGKLSFNICHGMSKIELIKVLGKLQKGKFDASEKTKSELVKECRFTSVKPMIFECDGETATANSVHISVVPNAINVLES
jgi:diacylglycerol kinase (ATP)